LTAHAGSRGEVPRGEVPRIASGQTPVGGDHGAAAAGGSRTGGEPAAALQRLIALVFGALVLATLGGAFLAQRLKHAPTAVQSFRLAASFDPSAGGARALEQISFRPAHHGLLTVSIVDSSGDSVATLVRGLRWPGYRTLCLAWNGRRGVGRIKLVDGAPTTRPLGRCREAPVIAAPIGLLAPPGEYRARVEVRGRGPAVLSPSSFTLSGGAARTP